MDLGTVLYWSRALHHTGGWAAQFRMYKPVSLVWFRRQIKADKQNAGSPCLISPA